MTIEEAEVNRTQLSDEELLDAILTSAGLQEVPEDIPEDLEPLSEEELDELWARLPSGTPLSQLIIEERDEQF